MTIKINGRTPEEIKQGLECCNSGRCEVCPYDGFQGRGCKIHRNNDALALIQHLVNEQIAIFEDIRGICTLCAYAMPCYPFDCTGKDMGELCEKCPCSDCIKGSKWKYRGVKPNE